MFYSSLEHAAFYDCEKRLYCFANETLNGQDYSQQSPFYNLTNPLKTTDEFGVPIILTSCDGYLVGKDEPDLIITTTANTTTEFTTNNLELLHDEMVRDAIMYSVLGLLFSLMILFISYHHLVNCCCHGQFTIPERNNQLKQQAQFKSTFIN